MMHYVKQLNSWNYQLFSQLTIYQKYISCSSRLISSSPVPFDWEQPKGYDTGIQVYNAMVRKKVPLILRNKDIATWYMCGPTVYDDAHIGHASCYVKFDIIRRIMEKMFNIDVVILLGITDIDDKIIQKSRELGVSTDHITKLYEQDFFSDMAAMKVQPPSVTTQVTNYVPHIISFCENLIGKDFAYTTPEGNVYFAVSKSENYGKLSGQFLNLEANETLDSSKKDPKDFALWKAAKPGEPRWKAPWGNGRPGWHIECSTMASHIFGSQLDIHSGGTDLLFPHHENENAQSEAYHGNHQWVNYWMHSGHLHLQDDVKMSKSLKNTITIKEFLKENSANDFRVLCLQSPYRNNIEYSEQSLAGAKALHKKLQAFIADSEAYVDGTLTCAPIDDISLLLCLSNTKASVYASLADDFSTNKAFEYILNLVGEVNKCLDSSSGYNSTSPRSLYAVAACASYVDKMLQMFGVEIANKKKLISSDDRSSGTLSYVLDALIKFRSQVRIFALTTGPSSQPQYKMQKAVSVAEGVSSDDTLPVPPEQPPVDKGEMLWTTWQKKGAKEQRKEKEPLIKACDELRTELFLAGVSVKDRGKESSWSLLEDKSVDAKKAKLSSHDAFDPQYDPRS